MPGRPKRFFSPRRARRTGEREVAPHHPPFMRAAQAYKPFVEEAPTTPRPSNATTPWVDALPLAPTVSAALNPSGDRWGELAQSLTYGEVAARLHAAELGGLTEAVWQGMLALRMREEAAPAALTPNTPQIAQAPTCVSTPTDGGAEQHVPVMTRMRGRVPRSMESWQMRDGEWKMLGCLRAFRLVMANLYCLVSADARRGQTWRPGERANQRRPIGRVALDRSNRGSRSSGLSPARSSH